MDASLQFTVPDLLEGFPNFFSYPKAREQQLPLSQYIARNTFTTPDIQNILGMEIPSNENLYQQMGGHIKSPEEYEPFFQKAAEETGVDVRVLKAIAKAESDFRPNLKSSAGAVGIMQVKPSTAAEVGIKNPYDIEQNILSGARYYAKMLKMFNNDIDLALAAYNAGPGNVRKYGGIPPFRETQNYVRKIRNGAAVNNALKQMQYIQ